MDERQIAREHWEGRAAASQSVIALARARPGLQFIVKPHPAESRDFYKRLIADAGLGNVHFCPSDYIWNVLNATTVHLHRHCTTAIEAWMLGKPTVEMAMDKAPGTPWPDRELGSDMALDTEALVGIVDRRVAGEAVGAEVRSYRRDYVRTWFGNQDGKRCAAAATEIDALLRRRKARPYFRSVRGLHVPRRREVGAVLRYALDRLPNDLLASPQPLEVLDPFDKLVKRSDIQAYVRRVKPVLAALVPSL